MASSNARKGWIRDTPDQRDFVYAAPLENLKALPPAVDLRPQMPPVYDQGQLGSCTANAIAGAVQFERRRQKLLDFIPSRLFIYYNERAMEGTVLSDAGASIRDGIKSVNQQGDCPENEWPYDINEFTVQPPASCYTSALRYRAVSYARVTQTMLQMQACLASGFPFVFGFTVYGSFENNRVATTGVVPMPGRNEQVLGGHAMLAVGYLDKYSMFICRNSWGAYGAAGYVYMPYSYIANPNLTADLWTIKLES